MVHTYVIGEIFFTNVTNTKISQNIKCNETKKYIINFRVMRKEASLKREISQQSGRFWRASTTFQADNRIVVHVDQLLHTFNHILHHLRDAGRCRPTVRRDVTRITRRRRYQRRLDLWIDRDARRFGERRLGTGGRRINVGHLEKVAPNRLDIGSIHGRW